MAQGCQELTQGKNPTRTGSIAQSHMIRRLRSILTKYDTEPIELGLCAVKLIWGVTLLFFSRISARPVYAVLMHWITRQEYGVVTLVYGALQSFAILSCEGCRVKLRAACALFGVGYWWFLAVMFALTGPNVGACNTALFGVANGIIYYRLRRYPAAAEIPHGGD